MGRTGKSKDRERPRKNEDKPRKSPPAPLEDEEVEDGDIATPKHDRYGEDDRPL